jgi:acyl carrier protein
MSTAAVFTPERVFADLVAMLKDMMADFNSSFEGEISWDSRLMADLDFESMDVVVLVTSIEQFYHRTDFPFAELVTANGTYLDDLCVRDTVNFLVRYLNDTEN